MSKKLNQILSNKITNTIKIKNKVQYNKQNVKNK